MKEILCYLIPTIIVFLLIGILESAMLFEKKQEEMIERKKSYGNIESRELM